MTQVVLQNVKTGDVSVEEAPNPVLKPGGVLVRNVCSLVSAGTERAVLAFSKGSYLKKAKMRPDLVRKVLTKARNDGLWQTYKVVSELIEQKIPLGYSCAGRVIRVGENIHDLEVGQPVACAGLFAATHSEIVSVPRNLVAPIPDGCGFDQACYIAVAATAMQGIRLAEVSLGDNVLVYGLGLVGVVSAIMALAAGARVIGADIDPAKIELARELGCEVALADSGLDSRIHEITDYHGVDKVLLCAATKSNEPIERIPHLTRQKGLLVVVGDVPMNISRRDYYEKEIDIKVSRSYGPGRYDLSYEEGGIDYPYPYVRWTENRNMIAILDLIARGKLDLGPLTTHRFPISEGTKAYQLLESKEFMLGVLLEYPQDQPEPQPEKAVSSPPTAETDRKPGEVSLGIVGAGNFGKAFLLPSFQSQGVRWRSICTAGGISSATLAKKYSIEKVFDDPGQVIEDPETSAVIIATRHNTHSQYVCQALQAGKAVFVEKPLASTAEQLDQVIAAYQEQKAKGEQPLVQVGFNRRFSPMALSLKKTFEGIQAPLAVFYRVNAGSIPPGEWVLDPEQGGGRVVGEVCHFVDFISFLVGASPTAVSASAADMEQGLQSQVLSISLDFPDGSLGTIHYFANGHSSMPKEYAEVFGGGLCATMQNFRKLAVYGRRASGKTRYLNQVKGFPEEAGSFVKALRKGGAAPIPFDELVATTKATLLVSESLTSRRKVEIV